MPTTTSTSTTSASIYMSHELRAAARRLVKRMGPCDGVDEHQPRARRLHCWAVEIIAPDRGSEHTRLVVTGECPECGSLATSAETL